MRRRFEYKTIIIKPASVWGKTYDTNEIDKTLNQLGSEGWELVALESRDSTGTSYDFYYTFKREL
ncbi:DUF4177 domain-containing protein [Chryseobacterium sp. T1]